VLRSIIERLTGTRASTPLTLPGTQGGAYIRSAQPAPVTRDGRAVRVRGWEQHPVVQACARVITDITATVPLVAVGRPDPNGQRDPLPPSHPLSQLLAMPAPRMTPRTLRAHFALDVCVYGNALWRIDRANPRQPWLRRVNPEGIQQIYVDADGDPVQYVWSDSNGVVRQAGVEDIIHFRDLSLTDASIPDVFGYPRAAAALTAMASDLEASAYVRQVVSNDGAPPYIVLMHDEATAADAVTLQERYIERQVNRGRRGVPEFLGGVRDVKALGFTLNDLEFPDLRRISREDICASFGVDPRIIGVGSASSDAGLSGTQYVEARARLIQHTIEPLLALLEDELTTWLASEYGDVAIRYDREVLRELAEDDKATSERVRAEFAASLRSWQEARAALRLPQEVQPLDTFQKGLSSVFLPAAMVTVDPREVEAAMADDTTESAKPDAANASAPTKDVQATALNGAQVSALQDIIAQVANGSLPIDTARPLILAAFPGVSAQLVNEMLAGLSGFTPATAPAPEPLADGGTRSGWRNTTDERRALWRALDAQATAEEDKYQSAAMARFNAERRDINRILNSGKRAVDDPFVKAALARILKNYKPGGEYHRAWLDDYRSLIEGTYGLGASNTAARYGLSFTLDNPAAQQAIRNRAERLATLVGETTGREITAAVLAGEQAGMGVAEIARLIDATVFGGMAETRSVLIARTETVGALNEGAFDTAAANDFLKYKTWLSQGDDRVREDHALLDGETIAMADDWPIGVRYPGDPMGAPEQVIQCRCFMTFDDLPPEGA
jgi:HK97 family phage portal protein